MSGLTRRTFLGQAAASGVMAMAQQNTGAEIPKRTLGKTGLQASVIGMGGYHLGSADNLETAKRMVDQAIDAGINFFDNAWDYHEGRSEEWMGAALKGKRDKVILMSKVCTHGRSRDVGMKMLQESLRRLQTDHLDVWQIHEVIYHNDPELIFAPNGVAEALEQAKQQGKVRFVGFTGHKDPQIHLRMLKHGFPFDTVQMPLNAFDATFRSFEQNVLPEATRLGMAVFGMKSLGGSGEMVRKGGFRVEDGLRYAMSVPGVSVTISGMDTPDVLEQNLAIARGFKPFSAAEMQAIRDRCHPEASDGRYELFKTSKKYDGDEGRKMHNFPPVSELPA